MYVHVGPLDDILHSSRGPEPVAMRGGATGGAVDLSTIASSDELPDVECSGKECKQLSQPNTARSDSDAGTPREKSEWFRLRSASFEEMSRAQAVYGLGTEVRDKIDAIVFRYERLLETQLRQQQQYYEKLLSRETSRAFYASLNQVSSSNDVNSTHLVVSNENATTKAIMDGAIKDNINSDDDDNAEILDSTVITGGLTEEDINDIITAKLEISSIEYDNTLLLEKLRDVEAKTKRAQRQNDQLVRKRRQHLEKIESLRQLTKERQVIFEETVMDLEQQIRDLSFYARTQAQLTRSPIRTELEGGQVVGVAPASMVADSHQVTSTTSDVLGASTSSSSASATATVSRSQRSSSSDGKKKKTSKTPH